MTFLPRLFMCFMGALYGGFSAGILVSLYDSATSKGVPLIGALFIGVILAFAYIVLGLIAAVGGNVAWLALRLVAAPYEPYVLPLIVAGIDVMLLSGAGKSTDFFSGGGRWFPAGVLLVVLLFLFNATGRNELHG